MPKDEWYKDRQRGIARKAAREIATGQPSSFDWISEDIAPDGTTVSDATLVRGSKKKKSKIKNARTGGKKPGSTISDVTPVRGPKKKLKIKNKGLTRIRPSSVAAGNQFVVSATDVELLLRLVEEQGRRKRLLHAIGTTLSRGVGSQAESRKVLSNARAALAHLRSQCAKTINYVAAIQEMMNRVSRPKQTAPAGTHRGSKQGV